MQMQNAVRKQIFGALISVPNLFLNLLLIELGSKKTLQMSVSQLLFPFLIKFLHA